MKISAALIGLGGIAWKYDAAKASAYPLTQMGAIQAHGELILRGGCSPDKHDRDDFMSWSGIHAYASHDEMLAEIQPQLVGICSPSECHYEHFMSSVRAGVRMIWLEKPPATDLGQCREMARMADMHGVTVCVNYFRRYLPIFQSVKKHLQTQMGATLSFHIQYSPGLARNGCHLLDLLFFLADADGYSLLWKDASQSADSPSFALRLSTGQIVTVSGGPLSYHSNTISATCENGILTAYHGGLEVRLEQRSPNPDFPGFYTLQPRDVDFSGQVGLDHYMDYPLRDLVEKHAQGQPAVSNLNTALISMQLMQEVLGSA